MKLLIIGVMPQNMVLIDTIMHTTLNTINDAVKMDKAYPYMGVFIF